VILISESRGDLNRCPHCKGKPDQHITFSTLNPRMTLDYTYLTWSTYNNVSWVIDRFGWISLPLRNKDSRLHPQHDGWPICGSPPSFSLPHNQWSNRLKPNFCRWQATKLTGPIYQFVIGTFNTCSRGSTHRSLAGTGRATTLKVLAFHIPLPDLPN
jgi:hypothetical protein